MNIKDFKLTETNGELRIEYVGNDPKIDKGINVLNPKFATYHLINLLLTNYEKIISNIIIRNVISNF
jgi:hypothetical protein